MSMHFRNAAVATAGHFKACTVCVVAGLLGIGTAIAQEQGSVQVGSATVSVGSGTAILQLPDVTSMMVLGNNNVASLPVVQTFKFSEDFEDEVGWNVNGSISVPTTGMDGRAKEISLSGFWATIEDDQSASCFAASIATACYVAPLVDAPGVNQIGAATGPFQMDSDAERDVDQWGISLESKWYTTPEIAGVTRAPNRRYIALGADIRGIDQDLDARFTTPNNAAFLLTYDEELETRYYGAYAAWGGDYSPFLFRGLWERLGLQSSFRLRGGVYHAETDYEGRLIQAGVTLNANPTSALTLSDSDVAFIGGAMLETRKRIGQRATLALRSEYEYYSLVPEMAYNTDDAPGFVDPTHQAGTVLGDDDAYSIRTSLRLTVKLGPRDIVENSYK